MRGDGAVQGEQSGPLILVVGEAPGEKEDFYNVPFHPKGASGKLLRAALQEYMTDDEYARVLFTNAVRCRPPKNKIHEKFRRACNIYLHDEIQTIRPALIICCGATALKSVTGTTKLTGNRRVKLWYVEGDVKVPVVACFHPSVALHNTEQKPVFKRDIHAAVEILRGNIVGEATLKPLQDTIQSNVSSATLRRYGRQWAGRRAQITVDFETNSLEPYVERDFRVTRASLSDGTATLVVRLDGELEYCNDAEKVAALRWILTSGKIQKVNHHIKYDMHAWHRRFGGRIRNVVGCTLVQHALLFPIKAERRRLKEVAQDRLGIPDYSREIDALTKADGKKETRSGKWLELATLHPERLDVYSGLDAIVTAKLDKDLTREFKREDAFFIEHALPGYRPSVLYRRLSVPLLNALYEIEEAGMLVDVDYTEKLAEEFKDELRAQREKCRAFRQVREYEQSRLHAVSETIKKSRDPQKAKQKKQEALAFNPNSSDQKAVLLFDRKYFAISGSDVPRTATGRFQLNKDTVPDLIAAYNGTAAGRFLTACAKYKETGDILSKSIVGILERLGEDNRIRTSYNQDRASTARLSSSSPNLQNVDKDDRLRRMYIAQPGCDFVEADYSQIELRILAAYSKDPGMVGTFKADKDLHDKTARRIFGLNTGDTVSEQQRTAAKRVNFGIVYGLTQYGLSRQIQVSVDEAEDYIEGFFGLYPRVVDWMEDVKDFAAQWGRVYTMYGTWRGVPECMAKPTNKEEEKQLQAAFRQAINAPVQGTAALCTCVSIIALTKALKRERISARIVVTVHDSIGAYVQKDCVADYIDLAGGILIQEPMDWIGEQIGDVPICAEFKVGPNWGELQKWKP